MGNSITIKKAFKKEDGKWVRVNVEDITENNLNGLILLTANKKTFKIVELKHGE